MKSPVVVLLRAASVLPVLAGACTEPHYGDDAGDAGEERPALPDGSAVSEQRRPDAAIAMPDATVDSGPPTPSSPLEGMYAVRVRFFGRSSWLGAVAPLANELLVLASVAPDNGALHMITKTCRDRGYVSTPIGRVNAQMLRPELQPARDYLLQVDGTKFKAEAAPALLGYSEPPPSGCTPGAKVPRESDQSWLKDTCECPSSDLPPTLPTDCRVDDLDDDGKPGVTILLTGAVESNDQVRVRESSRYLDGVIDPEGAHQASYDKVEDLYQLQCAGATCTRADVVACQPMFNPVRFARLPTTTSDGEAWTCGALLSELNQGRYLPDEPLEFPSGC